MSFEWHILKAIPWKETVQQKHESQKAARGNFPMSIEPARHARLWCAVINSILLALWSIQFVLPHEWL
jgi:hypothetical protein